MSVEMIIHKLKDKIESFDPAMEVTETGRVVEIADGIAKVVGLSGCRSLEMLLFPEDTLGIAQNLEEGSVGVMILGQYTHIKEGDTVRRTGTVLSIPVGDEFLGRVVDPLMRPLDEKGEIQSSIEYPVEKVAPSVMTREPVSEALQTGIKAIDSSIPIGRGQRELIIGDRQTGKTTLALDTILNQKGRDVLCIYVAIAQKRSKIARIVSLLEERGAMEYTTIVLAGASEGASYSYLAPYSGVALAEYFMDQKKDVLIVYDDLSKHANAYREISLLLRRPPGREAYPGDVFYLHSRLLERACRRNEESGGGSITALPIIETQAGDVSAYIPTNVISITDGQIVLEAGLFYKGIRPAINVGASVSRVGSSAQIKSMKKVAGKMKLQMAQFREIEAFAQFASDLDSATKAQLERGVRIQELLKQAPFSPYTTASQVVLMYAAGKGVLDTIPLSDIRRWESEVIEFFSSHHEELLNRIEKGWDDDIEKDLEMALGIFADTFKSSN